MDRVGTLLLGTETDGGLEADDSRLVLLLLRLNDGVVDRLEVTNRVLRSCTFVPWKALRHTYHHCRRAGPANRRTRIAARRSR